MELGVFGLSAKATLRPADTARLARRAEELGYRSWWAGEHVVLPSPRVPGSPMAPTDPILDPLVHLSYVAALTERMELGTGVVILPQRNPLVLAKQAASLDVLSGGRLLLGVGAGYLEPEMTAVGVRLAERGRRTDEYLDAMRALWTQPQPGVPRPVRGLRGSGRASAPGAAGRAADRDRRPQPGRAPAGGRPGTRLDRQRQYPGGPGRPARRPAQGSVRGRPALAYLGRLEINFMQMNPVEVDANAARRYAELGVDRLLVYPLPLENLAEVDAFLERHAGLVSHDHE